MLTHCDRVLAALRSGPKTHHELYALGVIAHSRIAELRRRGHEIEQRRDGCDYIYQLVGGLEKGGVAASPPSSSPLPQPSEKVSSDSRTSGNSEGVGSGRAAEKRPVGSRPVQTCGSPAPIEQLSLLEAA